MNTEVETRNKSFEVDENQNRRKPKNNRGIFGVIALRSAISILLAVLLIFTLAWTWLYTIAYGPSDAMRERLVLESHDAGADWIPALVLPDELIEEILGREGQ